MVLVKTRVCVGCSVSRAHKTWSRSLLFKDFRIQQVELRENARPFPGKTRTFLNNEVSVLICGSP